MMDSVDRALSEVRERARRATFIAWTLALVLLLSLAGALSAAGVLPAFPADRTVAIAPVADRTDTAGAHTAGAPASESGSQAWDAVVDAEWDGPATHLDWASRGYSTAESSFVGQRMLTPGDRSLRTLSLTNDGPAGAGLVVAVRLDERIPAEALNPGLAGAVELFWNVGGVEGRAPFSQLVDPSSGTVEIAEVQVDRGETVAVEIGVALPLSTTGERNDGHASTELAFDVVATMSGDVGEQSGQPERLAATGAGSVIPFGIAAALLLFLGLLLLARRRRCDDCERTLDRDESWVLLHREGRGRHRVCPDCALLSTTATGARHH